MIKVEVIYLPASLQIFHKQMVVAEGTSVEEVLQASGIYQSYPEVSAYSVGIFSSKVGLDTLVKSGDRLEIYRPLLVDPKERRKQKARKVS